MRGNQNNRESITGRNGRSLIRTVRLAILLLIISGAGIRPLYSQTQLFSDDFETDKGWTLTGEFERGTPQGFGGEHGNPDPASAYSGSNVLGVDLSGQGTYPGDYERSLSNRAYTATSPAINCSGYYNVYINFRRWLGLETSTYDHGYIEVSTDGSTWNTVWSNTATVSENSWSLQELDISAYADNQPTVYVRFSIGTTDGSWQYCGWNIDDFEVYGVTPVPYQGSNPGLVYWLRGDLKVTGQTPISLWGDLSGNGNNASPDPDGPNQVTSSVLNGKKAMEFSGNDELNIPNDPRINTGTGYNGAQRSMAIVFKTGADVSTVQYLYEEGGGVNGIGVFIKNGYLYVTIYNDNATNRITSYEPITSSSPYILTFVWDNGTLTPRLNNSPFTNQTTAGTITSVKGHSGDISIGFTGGNTRNETGATQSGGANFNGEIAEIRYYDLALTTTEEQNLFSELNTRYQVVPVSGDVYYSYQTGSWNSPTTWTHDPSGTTQTASDTPGNDDMVVILDGRTVTLTANITETNLDVTIRAGGTLDMVSYSFSSGLKALRGEGLFRLASVSYPSVLTNEFVASGGGTTEYYNSANFTLPASQSTYCNLRINAPGVTATQLSDLTLNGNLHVMQGTYRINDNTAARRRLTIYGDVTVDNGASITVGTGVTNTTTNPTAVAESGTAPFIDYYDTQSHRVVVYGDFTNNGTVRFTNLTYPVYNAFPPTTTGSTTGFATVFFRGTTDNTLYCNGTTDFYNLVLDKGVDQTFTLTVYSTAYRNFRLFGANIAGGYGGGANPNLCKALWIRTGTLKLQGTTVIPSLTEGTCDSGTGGPNSDFFIPSNAALVLDGDNVVVLATADTYEEVNVAYGVSGGSGPVNGVSRGGCSSLSLYGLLKVDRGYLSTRESGGIIQWPVASGQFEINGGTVDTKQYRTTGASGGLASFTQTGGTFELRGRFQRTPSAYSSVSDLVNAPINTSRLNASLSGTLGTFNLNEPDNVFNMSGGTIAIYDVCGNGSSGQDKAFEVLSSEGNINVTSGTVVIKSTTGTVLPDSPIYRIVSNAAFGNFTVERQSGTATVTLDTYPLRVIEDFSVLAGDFDANDLNVTIGRNMFIAAGTSYITGTNWTIFDGFENQTITANTATPLAFNKLKMSKTADKILLFAGTQSDFQISDSLLLESGILNDGGKTITLVPSAATSTSYIYNSTLHLGTGKIVIGDDDPTVIDGDGTGVFKNLELNNTDASDAPVSLSADITISGVLTFSQDKLFDIGTYNLKFSSSASIAGYSATRFIQTGGNAGDGGVTRTYSASSASFEFPIGTGSGHYTPATITINGTPTTWGDISVNPVGYEHPATKTKNLALTYFWRVKSSGFTLGSATVTHKYVYQQSDVVTAPPDVTEDGYVAARFDVTTSTWTRGTVDDVDETNNIIGEPGSGSYLENTSNIDGDYTAGDDVAVNPFDSPTIFYSRQSGLWGNVNSWSLTDHNTDDPPASPPGANDVVIIGGNDSIYLNSNLTVADVDARSCAILKIEAGSALDIGYNPGCDFALVLSHPNGNGNIRIAANYNSGSTFQMPSGDFTEYNQNLGTTELYTTNPYAGTTYWLPNGVFSYGNLKISPRGGSNIIFPNNDLLIYGNLIAQGENSLSWYCPTWNSNYPTAPTARVAKTITIKGDFLLMGGALVWYGNYNLAQDFIIFGNLFVNTNAGIQRYSRASNQHISIGGDLINNALAPGGSPNTYRGCDFTAIPITFFGSSTNSLTNTSGTPYTVLDDVTVNKGDSQSDSLIIDIGGTLSTKTDNWLTLINGTLVYRRTNPGSDFTISTTTPFVIPETAGLFIDYPNNSGNRNILIANASNNANDVTLGGKITLKAGRLYIGPTNGTTNNNNDIVYTGDGNSTLDIRGGRLVVNGQIRRSTSTTTGVLKYNQSGGDVVINGQGADATSLTRAKLEVVNNGSEFNMSGGTLTVVRGGGNTFGDLYIRPQSGSVTGGEIIFTQVPAIGPTVNAAQSYSMDANITLNNLTITGKTAGTLRSATLTLMVNPLVLNGNLTLSNNQSTFDSNSSSSLNVTLKGDFTNNGNYQAHSNTTTFNGGVQNIQGSSTTTFHDLVINPVTSVILNGDINVDNDLSLLSGQLLCGDYFTNLSGNLLNNATYTDNNTGITLQGTSLQEINGTGTFGTLELNNSAGAKLLSSISLNSDFKLTRGKLNINKYLLNLSINSDIVGSGFDANKMIEVDGVFSNVGIRKYFDAYSGADQTFTYPLGSGGKYTPVEFTYSNNDALGYIRINTINSYHPGVLDRNAVLQYYWEVENSAVSNINGKMVFHYSDGDVRGSEPDYVAARTVGATSWSKAAPGASTDNVDETADEITFYFSGADDLNGEYTCGEDPAFPNNIPQFSSTKNGDWNDPTTWVQTGGDPYTLTGAPNGFIVTVLSGHEVTINENYAFTYRTTIEGKLKAVQPYFGHNLGTIEGDGTLYVESGNLPAGRYTSFFDCSNGGTLEYGGNSDYNIIADLYSTVPGLHFTGTGKRVLPNVDLTVCNRLLIDGPTLDNSVNNRKLTIQGTMERYNTGAFIAGSGANAVVEFSGSSAQTLGGTLGNFTGSNKFNHFVIDNPNGLTINNGGNIEIGGDLYLTSGNIVTSSTNTLTITNTSINCVYPSGGSSSSFVDGPLTKRILSGDSFKFPIGKGSTAGNKITLSSTQSSTIDWTVEFFTPNPTYGSYAAPLTYINSKEYWTVSAPSGSQAYVGLDWDPVSDLTPLMTQNGVSDMRVAYDNSGTWTELTSTATGDNNNGTVTTSSRFTISASGTNSFTTACINTTKPKARLNPSGPVCGDAGIPVLFTGSSRPFNYILGYTVDGVAQPPVTVTSEPYVLPTGPTGATYQLTSFTYNDPSSPTTGVVDPTAVTTYTPPTTAQAGPDQSLCGASSATLAGNTPAIGTGLWDVITGTGGTVVTPTSPTSDFNGTNGTDYQLTWTITNGGCSSSDTVNISFPLLPEQPASFILSDDDVCQGETNVAYSVSDNPSLTYTWGYSGTGATIVGSGSSISIDYSGTATSGDVSVYTTNGCGNSSPLTLSVTVRERPNATIAVTGTNPICDGNNTQLTVTFSGGTSPYSFTITNGTNTESFTNATSPYVYTPANPPLWTGPGISNTYTYSIPTVTSANGCSNTGSNTVDIQVYKIPETGPAFHIPDTFAN